MTAQTTPRHFSPADADAAGVVSWIHIGDLHMVKADEENHRNLEQIVKQINISSADAISFVFLPGDNADDGSRHAYSVVRKVLDELNAPWCAIVGDHDVHEKSLDNFLEAMSAKQNFFFAVGDTRFIALNAFDVPRPDSFTILPQQMLWCEKQLAEATALGQQKILFLHCYPSELKEGSEELIRLIRRYEVRLIDMGHTHYNEVSNDGRTLYTATRSTGQIEEGEVGFSVTNIDGDAISWRFFETGQSPALMITSPADERLMTDTEIAVEVEKTLKIRAKVWAANETNKVEAELQGQRISLSRIENSGVWQGTIDVSGLPGGVYSLRVWVEDSDAASAEDVIRVLLGAGSTSDRSKVDLENALSTWPEHGLLGTQLGPNKNGRKW